MTWAVMQARRPAKEAHLLEVGAPYVQRSERGQRGQAVDVLGPGLAQPQPP